MNLDIGDSVVLVLSGHIEVEGVASVEIAMDLAGEVVEGVGEASEGCSGGLHHLRGAISGAGERGSHRGIDLHVVGRPLARQIGSSVAAGNDRVRTTDVADVDVR